MRGIKHSLESLKQFYNTKFPNSSIEILEILPKEKVRCKDIYGEYITYFASLSNNHLPTFHTCTNKVQHFINRAVEIHKNKYDYSLVNLQKMSDKVKIICKIHGLFCQRAGNHMFGQNCPKCKIDKHVKNTSSTTNLFIEKANLKHNFKYDYDLVNYVNTITPILIICNEHGKFSQIPNSHLTGKGCRLCANKATSIYNSNNPSSWTYSNWEKSGNNSKYFDSFKVYVIECYNDNEKFYKIGKTYRKVEKRFNSLIKMPYKYKIIKIIKGTSYEISKLEKTLQNDNKIFKYIPKIEFKGNNECFSKIKI